VSTLFETLQPFTGLRVLLRQRRSVINACACRSEFAASRWLSSALRRSRPCSCKIRGRSGKSPCWMITSAWHLPVSRCRGSGWRTRFLGPPAGLHQLIARIGLTADGRILIDRARVECQSHRLTVEDPVSIEYITKHVAGIQQVRSGVPPLALLCPPFSLARPSPCIQLVLALELTVSSEIHPIRRCPTLWHLHPHRRIRPQRHHSSLVPDRAQRHLLRVESKLACDTSPTLDRRPGAISDMSRPAPLAGRPRPSANSSRRTTPRSSTGRRRSSSPSSLCSRSSRLVRRTLRSA
jgi:hypothetical protein